MGRARLFHVCRRDHGARMAQEGVSGTKLIHLSNSPSAFDIYALHRIQTQRHSVGTGNPSRYAVVEVLLDVTPEELCRQWEHEPCAGKRRRTFLVPANVLKERGELKMLPDDFRLLEMWNEEPVPLPRSSADRTVRRIPVVLVGDPMGDLEDVPRQLEAAGFQVRIGLPEDGDAVLFCVSCADGISEKLRQAVQKCAGRRLIPLGVLWTEFLVIDNKSLQDLLRCEEAELLSRVLPKELVDELPVFISGDIYLPDKLEDILAAKPQVVLCGA